MTVEFTATFGDNFTDLIKETVDEQISDTFGGSADPTDHFDMSSFVEDSDLSDRISDSLRGDSASSYFDMDDYENHMDAEEWRDVQKRVIVLSNALQAIVDVLTSAGYVPTGFQQVPTATELSRAV